MGSNVEKKNGRRKGRIEKKIKNEEKARKKSERECSRVAMGSGVPRSGSVWVGRREMKEEGKKNMPNPL